MRFGGVALAAAVLLAAPSAHANAAARDYLEGGGSAAWLVAGKKGAHVASVRVALDFRRSDRGDSTARYVVENRGEDAWEDDVVFVASAGDVRVTVDGAPTETRAGDEALAGSVSRIEGLPPRSTASFSAFHLAIAPHGQREIVVTFRAAPGQLRSRIDEQRQADGLTRLRGLGGETRISCDRFEYPLWPAGGFGDGVGAMDITVRVDDGAELDAGAVRPTITQAGPHEKTYALRIPPAANDGEVRLRNVVVDYPHTDTPAPLVGASAFVAMRFESQKGHVFGANGRLTGDVVFYDRFGVSAGMETDFTRTATVVATAQTGDAGAYGSAYVGAGGLVTVKPGTAVGAEVAAGIRLLVIPLDVALQVYPFRDSKAQNEIGVFRALVGLKAGF